ncbi:MAG: MFS transporter, partial [Burkholderiaceae bacterium]
MPARHAGLSLCGFYFLFYGFYGVTIPYLPVWLASRGLDPAFVGVVIAAAFLPKVVSAPVFAHAADIWGKHRVLIQLLLFATLFSLVLFFYAQTQAWFFSLTMAVNFFAPAILPLMDRAALAHRRADGASFYTTIRLCGSLGFAVFSLLCGVLIDGVGADGVIWLGAALTLACMVL